MINGQKAFSDPPLPLD